MKENYRSKSGRRIAAGVALACAGCMVQPAPAPAPRRAPPPVPMRELPPLPIESTVDAAVVPVRSQSGRITITSTNTDIRELLPLLASAAGVNLVMGPDVRGKVSVRFQDVPAIDALEAVIEQAGLTVGGTAPRAPWAKPVFYDLPVNVNYASETTLRSRFDITPELAHWVVKARTMTVK